MCNHERKDRTRSTSCRPRSTSVHPQAKAPSPRRLFVNPGIKSGNCIYLARWGELLSRSFAKFSAVLRLREVLSSGNCGRESCVRPLSSFAVCVFSLSRALLRSSLLISVDTVLDALLVARARAQLLLADITRREISSERKKRH